MSTDLRKNESVENVGLRNDRLINAEVSDHGGKNTTPTDDHIRPLSFESRIVYPILESLGCKGSEYVLDRRPGQYKVMDLVPVISLKSDFYCSNCGDGSR